MNEALRPRGGEAARPESVSVSLAGPLRPARFVERPNRFLLRCLLEDRGARTGTWSGTSPASGTRADVAVPFVEAHLADPGRLRELLVPGCRVWLRPACSPHRRTRWSAVLVEASGGEGLVSLDTTTPNALVYRALEAGALPELAGWRLERREAPVGGSRFDFLLRDRAGRPLVLEVKSVTLVEDGVGLFPDAVTARGARHVRELAELVLREEWQAAVLFVVQREDAKRVLAADWIDPVFAASLAEARKAGVRVLARTCRVTRERLTLARRIPVG